MRENEPREQVTAAAVTFMAPQKTKTEEPAEPALKPERTRPPAAPQASPVFAPPPKVEKTDRRTEH